MVRAVGESAHPNDRALHNDELADVLINAATAAAAKANRQTTFNTTGFNPGTAQSR